MEILNKLYDSIRWESSESRLTLICLDSTWTEILQWQELEKKSEQANDIVFPFLFHCSVRNLNDVLKLSNSDEDVPFERVIFLTSVLFQSRIQQLKQVLVKTGAPECAIISTVSPPTACVHYDTTTSAATGSHVFDGYNQICSFLEPANASVYYYPSHSLDLLSENLPITKKTELKILSSSQFRRLQPLTLSGLGITINSASEYQSIYDFPAADLPENVKIDLKWFAHEIAQSLIFDIGIDPTNSIFTVGRTSSLIGHNLLGIIDSINKNLHSSEFKKHLLTIHDAQHSKPSLKPASLILVDRWEDLFSPSSTIGNYPLAHRILNTLKLAQKNTNQNKELGIDVSLTAPWQQAVDSVFTDEPPSSDCIYPMSAVSGSGFKTLPSLRYSSDPNDAESENASILRYKMMACPEEEGRQALVEELKHRIFIENGNLPPAKKRGIGAEISALVQSLLEAPGRNDTSELMKSFQTNFNPFVCVKAERLIALSYAVIDAMQRSSAKQFSSICQWKASFDDRIQREFEVLANLFQYEDFDVTMAVIFKYFLRAKRTAATTASESASSANTVATTVKSPSRAGAKSKLKATSKDNEEEKNEPVDVIQALFMILGLLSLCRYKKISNNFMNFLLSNLAEYSLEASLEELDYWRTVGILSDSSLKEIKEWKAVLPTTDLDRPEIVRIITIIIEPAFQKLIEIQSMYSIRTSQLIEKRVFTPQTIFSNPYDLMNDFHTGDKLAYSSNASQTPQGLISRIVQDCMIYKLHHQQQQYHVSSPSSATSSSAILMKMLEHIENPLQQLAKKGFGLLSRGLGRLGFGGSENEEVTGEHPGSNDVIVLFVIGGISYKEVGQVQAVLQEYQFLSSNRIILMSNNTICAEEVLQSVFEVNSQNSSNTNSIVP